VPGLAFARPITVPPRNSLRPSAPSPSCGMSPRRSLATAAAMLLLLLVPAALADGGELRPQRGRHSEPFDRYEDGHLEEPLLDDDYPHDYNDGLEDFTDRGYTSATTTTTTKAPVVKEVKEKKKNPCFTVKSPLDELWLGGIGQAKTDKEGTECVFGVDPRDEGKHCIQQNGKYGQYGWCFTTKDKTKWGSCGAGCPMFGQEGTLAKRIREMEAKLDETRRNLIPKLAAATAKADCMDCQASLLATDAQVHCAQACADQNNQPAAKKANATRKADALVQRDQEATRKQRQRSGRTRAQKARIAELEAKLVGTKKWLSFLMAGAAPN